MYTQHNIKHAISMENTILLILFIFIYFLFSSPICVRERCDCDGTNCEKQPQQQNCLADTEENISKIPIKYRVMMVKIEFYMGTRILCV